MVEKRVCLIVNGTTFWQSPRSNNAPYVYMEFVAEVTLSDNIERLQKAVLDEIPGSYILEWDENYELYIHVPKKFWEDL